MRRRLDYISLPPIVLARMLGALLLVSIVGFYFVGRDMGLIAPIYSDHEATPEERRALAKHNAAVKHLIATRESRAAAVRAAGRAEQVAQAQRDAPPKPVETSKPVADGEPPTE